MNPPPCYAHPDVSWSAIAAECDRELAARRQVYQARVDRSLMTQAEADWQLALAGAWREDVDRFRHMDDRPLDGTPRPHWSTIPRRHAITWRDRRAGLLRELEHRERLYPRWISESRLTQAEADRRTACLTVLLACYERGWDCDPRAEFMGPDDFHAMAMEIWQRRAGAAATPQQELFA
jgi:hypothetical protein